MLDRVPQCIIMSTNIPNHRRRVLQNMELLYHSFLIRIYHYSTSIKTRKQIHPLKTKGDARTPIFK